MENGGIERNYESRSICATIRPIPRRVVNEVLPQATKETAMASYQLYRRDLITGHFDRITQLDCGDDIEAISLARRSEEHTSELQSLMRISYAVFCLKKKKEVTTHKQINKRYERIVHTHTTEKRHT